jgi:hypothetical protein
VSSEARLGSAPQGIAVCNDKGSRSFKRGGTEKESKSSLAVCTTRFVEVEFKCHDFLGKQVFSLKTVFNNVIRSKIVSKIAVNNIRD